MKIFWFDTETTGLDAKENDIVQIAGVIEKDGVLMEEIDIKMRPFSPQRVTEEALQVQGRTIGEIMQWQEPKQAHAELCRYLGKHCYKFDRKDKMWIAGQNIQFDDRFLRSHFEKCGDRYYGSFFMHRNIDLKALMYLLSYFGKVDLENYKLATIAKHYDVSFGEEGAHDALADVRVTRQCVLKALDEIRSLGSEVKPCSGVADALQNVTDVISGKTVYMDEEHIED